MRKIIIKNKNIFISIIIALIFAIISYMFVPTKEYDLYQYRKWCHVMLTLNSKDLVNYIFLQGEFLIMLYFLLIAKLGNIQLLQFFPVLIIYSILSYIILDYSSNNNIKKEYTILTFLILFSLFKYIFAVSSFRYVLAYSIYFLAIYINFFKEKKYLSYFLYILPIFIHASTIILVLIRIIYSIKNKIIKNELYLLILTMFIFPNILLFFVDKININGQLNMLLSKINLYLKNENVSFNLQYVFRIIQIIYMLLIGIYVKKISKKNDSRTCDFYNVNIIFCVITTALFQRFSLFMRLVDLSTFLFTITLLNFFKEIQFNKWIDKIIIITLFVITIVGIRIQIPVFFEMF